ncbi:MAG: GNAT family N-acetyltransferase [Candidatus Gastranaerophilales bacterium]|nr:GNAT family N-acetyltransferase [Candidatus Gastranaerophilales bacterium]
MKILNISPLQKINSFKNVSFRASNNVKDSFTLEDNKKIQKVTIKDLDDNDIEALVVEKESKNPELTGNEKDLELYVQGERVAYAILQDTFAKDCLRVAELYADEHKYRRYKGIGTQLLKLAVLESQKRGYGGNIVLEASHSAYSPLAFYYKNNFVIPRLGCKSIKHFPEKYNCAIDLAVREGEYVGKYLPIYQLSANMHLYEKDAKALLKGKRLYKDRKCELLSQKEFNGMNYSAYFFQSPYENEFFTAIVNNDAKKNKVASISTLYLKENEQKQKYFEVQEIDDCMNHRNRKEVKQYMFDTLDNLAQKFNYAPTQYNLDVDDLDDED